MQFIHIFSGLLTPIIGITTIFILDLQYSLQEYKVRHDLYEPRMKVYRAIIKFLEHVNGFGDASQEDISELIEQTAEAHFLFKGKIEKHIQSLQNRGIDIQGVNMQLRNQLLPIGERRNKLADALGKHFAWFNAQFEVTTKLFDEYLKLDR